MDADDLEAEFPQLAVILGAYLNQDFDIYGPTLEDAVKVFLSDSTAEQITAARAEIARFLITKANDLDAELVRLSGEGYAHEPGMDAREFLLWLEGLLTEGLGGKDDVTL